MQNITINKKSNQVAIYIRTPYKNDYIEVKNQLFQVLIRSSTKTEVLLHNIGHFFSSQNPLHVDFVISLCQIQNISSSHEIIMRLSMDRLQKGTKHDVKVRAMPYGNLEGTWSEWSEWYSFDTPSGK